MKLSSQFTGTTTEAKHSQTSHNSLHSQNYYILNHALIYLESFHGTLGSELKLRELKLLTALFSNRILERSTMGTPWVP